MKISFLLVSCIASSHWATTVDATLASEGNLRANRALSLDETHIDVEETLNLYKWGALTQDEIKSRLGVICHTYSDEDCWADARVEDRVLVDEGWFDSQALLDDFPDNRDTIAYTHGELMTWLDAGEWSSLMHDSLHVRYVKLVGGGSKGALVVSPGQNEPTAKYAETLRTFVDAGYSPVFSIDHVSQGTSDRPLDDHFKQHIVDGADFVSAFKAFLDVVLNENSVAADQPRFLACHSMGCAIAFTLLIEDYEAEHLTRFNAVVANAPLIKADTSPFPYTIATAIGDLMVGLGLGENYAPTREKTFVESYGNQNFEGSSTSSLMRWLLTRDLCVAAKDQEVGEDNHIGLCLGGISANFARELFRLYNTLDDFSEGQGKISTPVLIQMAGDPMGTDGSVQNPDTANFCSEALKHCTLENFRESRHNIWWEADEIRDPALAAADDFFQLHAESKRDQCPPEPACGEWDYSRVRCKDSSVCSRQYKWGDWSLDSSCRPRSDVC